MPAGATVALDSFLPFLLHLVERLLLFFGEKRTNLVIRVFADLKELITALDGAAADPVKFRKLLLLVFQQRFDLRLLRVCESQAFVQCCEPVFKIGITP